MNKKRKKKNRPQPKKKLHSSDAQRSNYLITRKTHEDMRSSYPIVYTITTPRFEMRPYQKTDAVRYSEIANDERVQALDFGVTLPFTPERALKKINTFIEWWNNGRCCAFLLERHDDGEIIGGVTIYMNPEHKVAEFGYWLGFDYWGNGYATEAARAVLQFGFGDLKMEKMTSQSIPENTASVRLLRKVGMKREGTLKKQWIKDGERKDLVRFGLLKADYYRD